MKKSIPSYALVLVSVIAVLSSFTGCSQSKDDNSDKDQSDTSVVSEVVDPLKGQWRSEKFSNYIYTFNGDGTGQYDTDGTILKLTYSTENDRITIRFLADGYSPVTLNYVIEGDRLNIKDSFGNDTYYVRVQNNE